MRPAGLVIAGGLGLRMGGAVAKPLLAVGGATPFERALACLAKACAPVLVSANDPASFEAFGLEIVPDRRSRRLGPLAGLEAAAERLTTRPAPPTHLVCVPGDTPFLPLDLVARLLDRAGSRPRIARHGTRDHPTVALWPLAALGDLSEALDAPGGDVSLMALLRRTGFETVEFPADPSAPDGDPFFNVNTPDDLDRARRCAER